MRGGPVRHGALSMLVGGALSMLMGAALLLVPVVGRAGGATAAEPVRVAALIPFAADAIDRAGAPGRVVASVRRDMRQPPAAPVVDLGSPHAPSFERLVESRAGIVIGDRALHAAIEPRLRRLGTDVMLIDSGSIDSTFTGLREAARRVHVQAAMAAAISEAERELAALVLAQPVRTLLLFGTPGEFFVATERTWLGDLLRRLNFQNVGALVATPSSFPGLVQVSDEVLATLDPELVLLVPHGEPDRIRMALARALEDGGPWAGLRRTARCGLHVLPTELFISNPGLRMPEAARHLRQIAEQGPGTS
jgi:iron complex transport system substrate-binding protein